MSRSSSSEKTPQHEHNIIEQFVALFKTLPAMPVLLVIANELYENTRNLVQDVVDHIRVSVSGYLPDWSNDDDDDGFPFERRTTVAGSDLRDDAE